MHSFIAKMVINHFSFCICQATWLKLAETHKNGGKILLRYQPSEEPCGPFLLLPLSSFFLPPLLPWQQPSSLSLPVPQEPGARSANMGSWSSTVTLEILGRGSD